MICWKLDWDPKRDNGKDCWRTSPKRKKNISLNSKYGGRCMSVLIRVRSEENDCRTSLPNKMRRVCPWHVLLWLLVVRVRWRFVSLVPHKNYWEGNQDWDSEEATIDRWRNVRVCNLNSNQRRT
jgi:hypothetical protein